MGPSVCVAAMLVLLAGGASRAAADGMMLVNRGPFTMGSDRDAPDESPAHRIYLGPFWIDRHKVTNREFAQFLDARGLKSPEGEDYFDWEDADARIHRVQRANERPRWVPDAGFADHPAVEVTWFGARDYCRWRGLRLPTEAEWEKAARGDDGRRYPWGDEPPTPARAVYGRAYNGTEPTGDRPGGASPLGVHDLGTLIRDLESAAGRTVDLVHLDEAGPALAYRVFRDGVVVVQRDRRALVHRKAKAILDYLDFKPIEDVFVRGALEAAKRGR